MDILTIDIFLGGMIVGGFLGTLFIGMAKPKRRRYTDEKIKNVLYHR